MKNKYLLIIGSLLLALAACKKSGNNYPVIGKWQETKLRIYETDGSGAYVYDTTFFHPFTGSDYIAFNNSGTCTTSSDYYYYPTEDGHRIPPQKIQPQLSAFNYIAVGSKYVLTTQSNLINPGGFIVRDTVMTLDAHTLLLHSISYGHSISAATVVYDSYYSK